ncbi:hypothetical protein MUNTM_45730 [Mycobacterium sp. MUNTM1]
MAQKPQNRPQQAPQKPVVSRRGTISVLTNERGLPTALKINPRELRRRPQDLADEILALCQLSATRAQVAFRRGLAEQGYNATVIREIGLPTDEDLARAEELVYGGDDDEPPATFMRSV